MYRVNHTCRPCTAAATRHAAFTARRALHSPPPRYTRPRDPPDLFTGLGYIYLERTPLTFRGDKLLRYGETYKGAAFMGWYYPWPLYSVYKDYELNRDNKRTLYDSLHPACMLWGVTAASDKGFGQMSADVERLTFGLEAEARDGLRCYGLYAEDQTFTDAALAMRRHLMEGYGRQMVCELYISAERADASPQRESLELLDRYCVTDCAARPRAPASPARSSGADGA
jgi:hypothetical protein